MPAPDQTPPSPVVPALRGRGLPNGVHPPSTAPGVAFNAQPYGEAALAIECRGATPDTVVIFGDQPLETAFGSAELVTALVPPELFAQEGVAQVYLRQP